VHASLVAVGVLLIKELEKLKFQESTLQGRSRVQMISKLKYFKGVPQTY